MIKDALDQDRPELVLPLSTLRQFLNVIQLIQCYLQMGVELMSSGNCLKRSHR